MKLILLWSWIFMCIRSDFRELDPVVIVIYLVWKKSPIDRQKNMLTRQLYSRWYLIIIFNFLTGEVGAGGWSVGEWHLTDKFNKKNWDAHICSLEDFHFLKSFLKENNYPKIFCDCCTIFIHYVCFLKI